MRWVELHPPPNDDVGAAVVAPNGLAVADGAAPKGVVEAAVVAPKRPVLGCVPNMPVDDGCVVAPNILPV